MVRLALGRKELGEETITRSGLVSQVVGRASATLLCTQNCQRAVLSALPTSIRPDQYLSGTPNMSRQVPRTCAELARDGLRSRESKLEGRINPNAVAIDRGHARGDCAAASCQRACTSLDTTYLWPTDTNVVASLVVNTRWPF